MEKTIAIIGSGFSSLAAACYLAQQGNQVTIYEKNGYDNVTNPFQGFSDGRGTVGKGNKLPTGTYFYTLEYDDAGRKISKSGYLYVSSQ